MARGQQKIQSQQKAQEKNSKAKKQAVRKQFACFFFFDESFLISIPFFSQGHSLADQQKAAQKALQIQCTICKGLMPDPKTYK